MKSTYVCYAMYWEIIGLLLGDSTTMFLPILTSLAVFIVSLLE